MVAGVNEAAASGLDWDGIEPIPVGFVSIENACRYGIGTPTGMISWVRLGSPGFCAHVGVLFGCGNRARDLRTWAAKSGSVSAQNQEACCELTAHL